MENQAIVKRYKIPQDLLMDILRIVFKNNIKHKLEGIKEKENIIVLQVHFTGTDNNKNAQENIEGILTDYCEYMKGLISGDALFMDEQED